MKTRHPISAAGILAAIALGSLPLGAQDPGKEPASADIGQSPIQVPDLGVKSRSATAEEAGSHNLPAGSGFVIESVEADGTAAALGLEAGDIVTRLAGRPAKSSVIDSLEMFAASFLFPDDEVEVEWLRDGKVSTATAKLTRTTSSNVVVGWASDDDINQADLAAAIQDALAKALGDPSNPAAGALRGIAGAAIAHVSMNIPGKGTASQSDGTLTIKDTAGKVIYCQENFSIDEHLDDVPADFRDSLKMVMGGFGGGILGLDLTQPGVEESDNELLEKAAEE